MIRPLSAAEPAPLSAAADRPVLRVLEEYLAQLERGEPMSPEELLARHPEHAAALHEYLASLDFLHRAALNLRNSAEGAPQPVAARTEELGQLGDFRLVREIGRGGMGVVYEAVQISLNRRVALKVLPFAAALDAKQLQRFKNESQAAAHLHHQNIVPVHAVGTERGVHYYAMQFIDGRTLAVMIDEQRRLAGNLAPEEMPTRPATPLAASVETPTTLSEPSPAAAPSTTSTTPTPAYFRAMAGLGVQAATALEHAHQLGVIHRDIKPANLLVDVRGNLWITDFGLAHCQSHAGLTMSGDLVGTLRYMSPEQALAKRVVIDHRTDIYSLGATLYELLTLEPAFNGHDRHELLRQIAFEEPKPLRRFNKAIPVELDTIVLKALSKNPEERYATAKDLADDLSRFLEDKPIRAKRPTVVQRLRKWRLRHQPLVWSAAISTVVLLVLVAIILAISNVRISKEAEATRFQRQEAVKQEAIAKEKGLLARRHYYAAQMNLAYQAWEAGNLARVLDLLESQRPRPDEEDLRTFEWYYLWRLCYQGRRLTLRGHSNNVHSIAFSPDGKTLVSGSGDGTAKLWDLATGQARLTLQAGNYVSSVAFSPDGKLVATGNWWHQCLRLWDTQTGRLRNTLGGYGQVWSVAFSPDGKTLVAGNQDHTVVLWDVATGQPRATLRGQGVPVLCVAVSPDGKTLASSTTWSNRVKVWDAATCQERYTLEAGHPVAFAPDGTLATGGWVGLWDVTTGQRKPKGPGVSATALAFSPDGKTLALAGADKNVRLWDVATGQMRVHHGRHARINSITFSPDGKTLATAGNDSTIELWDVSAPSEPVTLAHAGGASALAFSPGGKTLASGGDRGIRLWDVLSGEPIGAVMPGPSAHRKLAFSHDGKTLACAQGNAVKLTDVASRQVLHTLVGHGHVVYGVAFAPDNKTLGSIANDGTLKLWDLATGRARTTLSVPSTFTCLAFSPDVRSVASGGQYLRVELWDPATGAQKAKLESQEDEHFQWTQFVAFSPDGKILAAGGDQGNLKLWSTETATLQHALRGHTETVVSLAFSPDGKTLASGCVDGTVKLWDTVTGQERVTLKGFAGWASVAFCQDGSTLAMVGNDGNVKLLRAATDAEAKARKTELDADDAGNPRALITAGDQLWKAGRLDEAEKAYWQALSALDKLAAEFPNVDAYRQELARAWLYLNVLLLQISRPLEAQQARARALALMDKLPVEGKHALARQYGDLGESLLAAGLNESAQRLISQAIELNPEDWRVWDRRGRSFLRLRQYDKAAADFTMAIECQSANWLPWADRGTAHGRLQQWDKALADYSQSIDHGAPREWVWAGRADCYAQLGQWEKAAADFGRAIELKPDDAETWSQRGQAHGHLGQWDKALSDYFKAIELAKDNQALAVVIRQRLEADFAKALECKPDDARLWIARGRYFAERGEHEQADADFTKAAALTPDELNKFIEAGWWIVGPYPGDSTKSYAPEKNPDPSKPVAGPLPGDSRTTFSWRSVPNHAGIGLVDLGAPFNNAPNISVYALGYVYSPEERSALLRVGGSRDVRLWLNGRLIYEASPAPGWEWQLDALPVTLRVGRNVLLARVANGNAQLHRLFVRVTDNPLDRGWHLGMVGLWEDGAGSFARAYHNGAEPDLHSCRVHAQLLLATGDTEGYSRACDRMLNRWDPNAHPNTAFNLAYACCWADGVLAPDRLLQMARKGQVPDQPSENYRRVALGLALFRAGQLDQAIPVLNEFAADGRMWPVLAMAHHRAGRTEDARKWLKKADGSFDGTVRGVLEGPTFSPPSGNGLYNAEFWILYREAKRLIDGKADQENERVKAVQARARQWLQQRDKSTAAFDLALALHLQEARLWLARGRRYAELKQWEKAAADFARAATLKGDDPYTWYEQAMAYLAAGDLPAYRRVCADMVKRFGQTKDQAVAARVIYTCVTADASAEKQDLLRLMEIAAPQPGGDGRLRGGALCRAGQHDAAVRAFEQAAKAGPAQYTAWDWLFLALSHHHLGHTAEARRYLAKAAVWIDEADRDNGRYFDWGQRVEFHHLRSEVERLLATGVTKVQPNRPKRIGAV